MNKEKLEISAIPGLNPEALNHFRKLGKTKISELKDVDPDDLYLLLCRRNKEKVDRVMLYILRYAVYYASNEEHDPELLHWWNWKDSD